LALIIGLFLSPLRSVLDFSFDNWHLLLAGVTVALGNCAYDLKRTWVFYNPTFADAYNRLFPQSVSDESL
jgi:hypothetical protein